jgi:hypothetical protein
VESYILGICFIFWYSILKNMCACVLCEKEGERQRRERERERKRII